jgi:hypothetical protein
MQPLSNKLVLTRQDSVPLRKLKIPPTHTMLQQLLIEEVHYPKELMQQIIITRKLEAVLKRI